MKTLKKIIIKPIYVDHIPNQLDQDVIYISNKFETAVHLCLCGCENESVTPFRIESNGWDLIEDNNKISLTPSILNTNCPNKYHYIITKNIANVC